jgi:hypothetical protein
MPTNQHMTLDEQMIQYMDTQGVFTKKVLDTAKPVIEMKAVLVDVAASQENNLTEANDFIQQLQSMTTKILSGDEKSHHMQPNLLASAKDLLSAIDETAREFQAYKAQGGTTLPPLNLLDKEYNATTIEFKALEKRFNENYPDAKKALLKKTNQEPGAVKLFQEIANCQGIIDNYLVKFRSVQQQCQTLITEIDSNNIKLKTAATNLQNQITSKEKVTKATLPSTSGNRNAFLANPATVAPEPTAADKKEKGKDDQPPGVGPCCTIL